MEFTCCKCEFKFHYLDMDLDERMCFECLDEIIDESNPPDNNTPKGTSDINCLLTASSKLSLNSFVEE